MNTKRHKIDIYKAMVDLCPHHILPSYPQDMQDKITNLSASPDSPVHIRKKLIYIRVYAIPSCCVLQIK